MWVCFFFVCLFKFINSLSFRFKIWIDLKLHYSFFLCRVCFCFLLSFSFFWGWVKKKVSSRDLWRGPLTWIWETGVNIGRCVCVCLRIIQIKWKWDIHQIDSFCLRLNVFFLLLLLSFNQYKYKQYNNNTVCACSIHREYVQCKTKIKNIVKFTLDYREWDS